MVRKHFIAIIFVFIFLTLLETGIFLEVLWHGWGGFGDISLEYTKTGTIGISFLIFLIPISAMAILFIRIILCIKKIYPMKWLFLDCICALFGIGIVIGIYNMAPNIVDNSFGYQWGRQVAAFFIDYFNWMTVPFY